MRILVCFKVLPDFEQVLESDWDTFSLQTDLSYAKRVLNCFDESALELALLLRDALLEKGEAVYCEAATVGREPPPALRKNLYAVGFDTVRLLKTEQAEFAPAYVAQQLAAYYQEQKFDLILAGKQAGYADTGSVPLLLAELLDMPAVADAQTLRFTEQGLVLCHTADAGREELTVKLPLLISIGNSPYAALRAATLRQQLEVSKRPLQVQEVAAPRITQLPLFVRENYERCCAFWKGDDLHALAARLRTLLSQESLQKSSQLVMQEQEQIPELPEVPACPMESNLPLHISLVLPHVAESKIAFSALWNALIGFFYSKDTIRLWLPGFSAKQAAALPLPKQVQALECAQSTTTQEPEAYLSFLEQLYAEQKPDILLFWGNTVGHALAVRLSARLGCPCLPQITALRREQSGRARFWAEKQACSSQLLWRVPVPAGASVYTVGSAFGNSNAKEKDFTEWRSASPRNIRQKTLLQQENPSVSSVLQRKQLEAAAHNSLETARVLFVGGGGLGEEGCLQLREFCKRYAPEQEQAAVGYSRIAATNGWGPLSHIVGQSGTITKPQICVAFGVSGASAFIAGVKQARTLIAVNSDPDAPIFRQADIGILVDAQEFLQVLNRM